VARAASAIDIPAHYVPQRYLDLIERDSAAFGARILSGNARRLLGL
jgi:hypothetical protein